MAGSLMTAAEVAELLGVPVSWVYEQSRRRRIPTLTLGRYRRYRRGGDRGVDRDDRRSSPERRAFPRLSHALTSLGRQAVPRYVRSHMFQARNFVKEMDP